MPEPYTEHELATTCARAGIVIPPDLINYLTKVSKGMHIVGYPIRFGASSQPIRDLPDFLDAVDAYCLKIGDGEVEVDMVTYGFITIADIMICCDPKEVYVGKGANYGSIWEDVTNIQGHRY